MDKNVFRPKPTFGHFRVRFLTLIREFRIKIFMGNARKQQLRSIKRDSLRNQIALPC
jgi:hypothetical protein